jgi:hypothetical protein
MWLSAALTLVCVCVCWWLACSKARIAERGVLLCMALGLASLLRNRDNVLDSFETSILQGGNLKPQIPLQSNFSADIIIAHKNERGTKDKSSSQPKKQGIGYTQETHTDVQQRNIIVCKANSSCNWGNQILFRRRTFSEEIISVHNNSTLHDKQARSFTEAFLDWYHWFWTRGKEKLLEFLLSPSLPPASLPPSLPSSLSPSLPLFLLRFSRSAGK